MSLMYDALRAGSTESSPQPAKSHGSTTLPAKFALTRTKLMLGCIAGLLLGGVVTGVVMRSLSADEAKVSLMPAAMPEKTTIANPGNVVNAANTVGAVNVVGAINGAGGQETVVSRSQVPAASVLVQFEPARKITPALPLYRAVATPALPQSNRTTAAVPGNVLTPQTGKEPKVSPKSAAAISPKNAEMPSPTTAVLTQPATTQSAGLKSITASLVAEVPIQAGKAVNLAANTAPSADDTMSLPDRFDAMNKALGKTEKSDAIVHLKAIQSALPVNSIARLRAEGWHEFQTGNIETAKTAYRKILERLPADDHAKAVLQAMGAQSSPPPVPK